MSNWNNLCISDKTGKQFFKSLASPMSTNSEIKNLKQHLSNAAKNPLHYKFLDIGSAIILLNENPFVEAFDLNDDDLLMELLK